jgi:predicted GIY-YIG superfamily endonuclease
LRLRKASRELVDEVKKYHFVFTKRDFARFQSWHQRIADRYAGQAGIYLLRGEAKLPLYIGVSVDLGRRLAQHAKCRTIDDNVSQVAVITGAELPGEEYQAAFKEDLVRRYRPNWNVNLVGLSTSVLD